MWRRPSVRSRSRWPASKPAVRQFEEARRARVQHVEQPPAVDAQPEQAQGPDAKRPLAEALAGGGVERQAAFPEDASRGGQVRRDATEDDGEVGRPQRGVLRQPHLDGTRDLPELRFVIGGRVGLEGGRWPVARIERLAPDAGDRGFEGARRPCGAVASVDIEGEPDLGACRESGDQGDIPSLQELDAIDQHERGQRRGQERRRGQTASFFGQVPASTGEIFGRGGVYLGHCPKVGIPRAHGRRPQRGRIG